MDVKSNIEELNSMILSGKMMEAFEKFYADDVVMQENEDEPRKGKELNREFEKKFLENVQEFHNAEVRSVAVGECKKTGNPLSSIEWFMDVTFKDGNRKKFTQVAVQRWNEQGQIVKEKFYYNPNSPVKE